MSRGGQHRWPEGIPPVGWGEHLLVIGLVMTLLLCVFVTLPEASTNQAVSVRHAARSYLRSLGVDQYWPMFVGEDWDIPELRVLAVDQSGTIRDVTTLMLKHGWIYEQVLDDRLRMSQLQIARRSQPAVMDSYAASLNQRLGPEVQQIRFEAVYRTTKLRKTADEELRSSVIPLGSYTRAEGKLEKD